MVICVTFAFAVKGLPLIVKATMLNEDMLPPDVSGIQDIVTEVLLMDIIETDDTGFGGASGVMALEEADGTLEPALLFAVTVNVYVTPFVSPVIDVESVG